MCFAVHMHKCTIFLFDMGVFHKRGTARNYTFHHQMHIFLFDMG